MLFLLIALVSVTAVKSVMPSGFVGSDTYPILLTSRYHSPAEAWDVVSSRLMPGFFPVDFYRPAAGLIWGACFDRWGLEATNYLRLNLVIHMLNALLLLPLAKILFGDRGKLLGPAGAILFALYPLSVDNVPVVSRMPDLLAGTLILLALLLHASSSRPGRALLLAPGAITAFLASGVKETAFILPLLLFTFDISLDLRPGKAFRRAIPSFAALVLFLVVRRAVLGGIGGYEGGDAPITRAVSTLVEYVRTLLLPFGPLETYRYAGSAAFFGRLGAALLAAFLWFRNVPALSGEKNRRRPILFLIVWIAAIVALHLPVRRFERRYIYLASLPSSLLLVSLLLSGPKRAAARAVSAAAAFLVVWQISFTPTFGGYQEWKIGDRLAGEFLDTVYASDATPGGRLVLGECPWKVVTLPKAVPRIDQAFILSERSVKAYVALRYPWFEGEVVVTPKKVYVDRDGKTSYAR